MILRLAYGERNPSRHLVLITRDGDFSIDLPLLHARGHRITLITNKAHSTVSLRNAMQLDFVESLHWDDLLVSPLPPAAANSKPVKRGKTIQVSAAPAAPKANAAASTEQKTTPAGVVLTALTSQPADSKVAPAASATSSEIQQPAASTVSAAAPQQPSTTTEPSESEPEPSGINGQYICRARLTDGSSCDKRFLRGEALRAHMQTKHALWLCALLEPWCLDAFIERSAMFVHVRDHHHRFICGVGSCQFVSERWAEVEAHKDEELAKLDILRATARAAVKDAMLGYER